MSAITADIPDTVTIMETTIETAKEKEPVWDYSPLTYSMSGPILCSLFCPHYKHPVGILGMVCERCGKFKMLCLTCVNAGRRSLYECGKEVIH